MLGEMAFNTETRLAYIWVCWMQEMLKAIFHAYGHSGHFLAQE